MLARLDAELTTGGIAVGVIDPASFDEIALSQVRLNQHPNRALTQRACAHRPDGGINPLRVTTRLNKTLRQGLQRMQQPLTNMLTLEDHPVFGPAWQQVKTVSAPVDDAQIIRDWRSMHKPGRPFACHADIHDSCTPQSQSALVALKDVYSCGLQPPQS